MIAHDGGVRAHRLRLSPAARAGGGAPAPGRPPRQPSRIRLDRLDWEIEILPSEPEVAAPLGITPGMLVVASRATAYADDGVPYRAASAATASTASSSTWPPATHPRSAGRRDRHAPAWPRHEGSERMTLSSRHRIVGLALLAAWMTLAGSAQAQSSFPGGKPITLLVGYAAGGTTDAAARFVAKDLEKELSTSVQFVNKPGAALQLALTTLRQARPDGLTLAYAVLPTIITHYLDPSREAPYQRKDFQPVAHHWVVPGMIAVRAPTAGTRP